MNNKVQRTFIAGDQWLYYKIYTGVKTADLILTKIIKPFADQLLAQGLIKKWFFIRYADPKHHIRIRLNIESSDYTGNIINNFARIFLDKQNIKLFLIL